MERLRLTSIVKGTKADLLADNEVRANSIMFTEIDSRKVKFADGVHTYAELPYVVGALDDGEGAVYRFKGSVATFNDLPKENNKAGDTYDVLEDGKNYAWTVDETWDNIGGTIDLTDYVTQEDLTEATNILDGKISEETIARQEADEILDEKISDEILNRQEAINSLSEIYYNKQELDTKFDEYYTKSQCDEKFLTEHQDISGKADKSEIPTKTSQLENDSDYTTNEALQAQVATLTQQIKDLKLLIPTEVFDATTARSAMNASGKVTLCEDINLGVLNIGGGMFANYNTSINLNGYTLQSGPTGGRALLLVRGTSNYTFNGKGEVIDTANDSSPVWCASQNASVTINDGTFIAQGHTECIYCELGTITINGGEFKTGVDDKRYLLNCKDANYQAGTAKIIVKGGKFWDFDPHNNTAEGAGTNFCADGYTTTSEEIDGHTVYTVVKA